MKKENVLKWNSLNPCKISTDKNRVEMKANPNSDFICKYKEYIKDSATFMYTEKEGDFTIKAKFTANGKSTFDALFLMVRESKTRWIKLALELGVDDRYNAVSVITNSWSDDANGELIQSNNCWLRITRKNDFWGLHYSKNGKIWRFVRAFGLNLPNNVKVGFGIQAPKGNEWTGFVENITIENEAVKNLRDGN